MFEKVTIIENATLTSKYNFGVSARLCKPICKTKQNKNPKKTEERAKVNYSVITTLHKWWEFLRHPLPGRQPTWKIHVCEGRSQWTSPEPGPHDPRRLSALCSRVPSCLKRESCSCKCVLAVWIVTLSFAGNGLFSKPRITGRRNLTPEGAGICTGIRVPHIPIQF